MSVLSKPEVIAALARELETSLARMVAAFEDTRKGATHEENRSEGDKDMRATEQSYLARGQAMRAEEIAEELQRLATSPPRAFRPDEPITAGALVRIESESKASRWFLLLSQGGGTELEVGDARVTVISPASPLGAILYGRKIGEDFEFRIRDKRATAAAGLDEWVIRELL